MRVLAVSGSLRAGSHNTRLLRAAAEAAPEGVEVELLGGDRRPADLPRGRRGRAAAGLRAAAPPRLGGADAILFATPEYNGSIPGGLKNAIDWASRPRGEAALTNKTVAVIGASTGQFGAMWAQADLRKVLGAAGARVVGEELPVAKADQGFDESVHERLRDVLESLVICCRPLSSSSSLKTDEGPLVGALRSGYQLGFGRGVPAPAEGVRRAARFSRRPLRWLGDSP